MSIKAPADVRVSLAKAFTLDISSIIWMNAARGKADWGQGPNGGPRSTSNARSPPQTTPRTDSDHLEYFGPWLEPEGSILDVTAKWLSGKAMLRAKCTEKGGRVQAHAQGACSTIVFGNPSSRFASRSGEGLYCVARPTTLELQRKCRRMPTPVRRSTRDDACSPSPLAALLNDSRLPVVGLDGRERGRELPQDAMGTGFDQRMAYSQRMSSDS